MLRSKFIPCTAAGLLMVHFLSAQSKPNILIILVDDAGYADFGFQGCRDLVTPNIDLIAHDGTVFTDAHVTSTVSAPSRAGLMTGRYQERFGYECNEGQTYSGLDTTETFIARDLKKAGYSTAAFGKWHLGYKLSQRPCQKGFDYFYGFLAGSRSYFYRPQKDDAPGNRHALLENNKQVAFSRYLTDELASGAVNFIHSHRKKPFFIYWAPNAVHTPLEATQEDLDKFKGHPRQMLAAMTYALDRGIGKIIAELKADGIYNNTLIFFLSDNGGAHNNQSVNLPLKGFKGNEYEGGHRVPFVVSWPEMLGNHTYFNGLSSSLDIYPTCLDAAGKVQHQGKPLDGVSLIPFLKNEVANAPHAELFWRKDKDASMRTANYKFIRVNQLGYRLYNISSDLGETNDLTASKPEKFNQLKQSFEQWESHMIPPLWTEGALWDTITLMIHDDLFHNRKVRVKDPVQLKKYLKKEKVIQ